MTQLRIPVTKLRIVADENIPFVHEFFDGLGQVETWPGRSLSAEQVAAADILLVRSVTPVNGQLLHDSAVGFVGTCTIGIDHLDVDYLKQQGISYSSAPGCNANSVVEYVLSVLARQKSDWLQARVGIIGCGNVGGLLYRRLRALGLSCRCYDPLLSSADNENLTSLDEVLQADVICMHTPLTTGGKYPSFHLLNESRLRSLPQGALLINAGRGAAIDNRALSRVLAERPDLQVVLDVWESEPELDVGLLEQVNLGSPHIAGYSYDGKVEGTAMIYRAVCEYLDQSVRVTPAGLLAGGDSGNQRFNLQAFGSVQAAVNQAILSAYDVMTDDQRLRQTMAEGEVAMNFDRLRKSYPKRREFPCFTVDALVASNRLSFIEKKSLNKMLATLGFTLERGELV